MQVQDNLRGYLKVLARKFRVIFIVLSCCFLIATKQDQKPSSRQNKKPNFIFFLTDDISPDDLSIYGNEFIKTPNLQNLAKTSLVFDNAYLTISSCSPSRCSIITGRYPHNTGAPELTMPLPKSQLTVAQVLRENNYFTVLSGKNHMAPPEQLGFCESSDSQPAGAENWIEHLRKRPKDRPFFFWFASHDAHHGFQFNDKAPQYAPSEIPVPKVLFDGPLTRKDLVGYYHEVSRTDYYVGLLIAELKRQNILDNTYFIYLSDNGRPFPRCKTYLYDSGIKTPLLISGPGVRQGRTSSLVSVIDLAPTILDLVGIAKPKSFQGLNLKPILKNTSQVVRKVAFAERNWHVYQSHERMVRFGDYMYIWNAWPHRYNTSGETSCFAFPAAKEYWQALKQGKLTEPQKVLTQLPQPVEQLFNVKDDPFQENNLINDIAMQDIITQSRALLKEWQVATGDSVPKNPRPNRQPLHVRKYLPTPQRDFAGKDLGATFINHPGPF